MKKSNANLGSVTVSQNFEITLTEDMRETLGVKAGDRLSVDLIDGKIQLKRIRLLHELLGSLPGPNNFVREKNERDFS